MVATCKSKNGTWYHDCRPIIMFCLQQDCTQAHAMELAEKMGVKFIILNRRRLNKTFIMVQQQDIKYLVSNLENWNWFAGDEKYNAQHVKKEVLCTEDTKGAAQQIVFPGAWDPEDPDAYTKHQGAPVPDILTGMLGPPCDENRDASHELQLKIHELHAKDPAKAAMKVEVWVYKGDGKHWVNTTSVIKYIYTGNTNHFARTQKSIFDGGDIPHKLLQVPGVRTTFLFLYHEFTGTKLVPSSKPPPDGGLRSWYKSSTSSTQYY